MAVHGGSTGWQYMVLLHGFQTLVPMVLCYFKQYNFNLVMFESAV